jgi:hypothetical protein
MLQPDYDVNKPIPYKDMFIFNNTTFQPLFEIPYTCDRSLESVCYEGISKQECIDKCQVNENCKAGYYILNKTNNKSLCNPIRTSVYRDYNFAQDLYDAKNVLSSDYEITSFIQKDIKYPSNNVIYTYYRDNFYLKNIETNTYLSTKKTGMDITFEKNTNVTLTCVSFETFFNKITNKKIRYGDKVSFMERDTSYILSFDSNQNIYWKPRLNPKLSVNDEFIILSLTKLKGEIIRRGDTFYLQNNLGSYVTVNQGVMIMDNRPADQLIPEGIGYLFTFENQDSLYICENSNCRELTPYEIDFIVEKNDYLYYKNNIVFKDARCSGYCKIEDELNLTPNTIIEKYENKKQKNNNYTKKIIILILIIIIIIINI